MQSQPFAWSGTGAPPLASVFGGGVWETEGCDDSPGEPDFCADPARGPRTAGLRSTDLSLSTYSFRRSDTGARALAFWVHGCDISPDEIFERRRLRSSSIMITWRARRRCLRSS